MNGLSAQRTGRRPRAPVGVLLALGVASALVSGCYTYTPIPAETAPVGETVRMVVTGDGASELRSVMDRGSPAPTIRGRVTGREGQSLLVRVPLPTDFQGGASVVDIGQVVRVPLGEILSMERQSFSRTKTSLFIAGSVAAAAFIVFSIIDVRGGDDGPEPPDPDVLFSIPIG